MQKPELVYALTSVGPLDAEFFRAFCKMNNLAVAELERRRRELDALLEMENIEICENK